MAMIDLHSHSTASDGTKSPSEIIRMAVKEWKEGPILVALTDHDTVAGVEEFLKEAACYPAQIRAVGGIELSTYYKNQSIHMLGYGIDVQDETLRRSLQLFRDRRDARNIKIIERLNALGMKIEVEDIRSEDPEASIGRPIIARYLMKHGYVSSVKEAFSKYIGKGKPCYVDREKPELKEVIDLIHQSKGIAVMAHPVQYDKLSMEEIDRLIASLVEIGLDGIEVYYSKNTPDITAHYKALAERYHLIATGGSDYHGEVKPDIALFYGRGDLLVPDEILTPFLTALERK